ncbi:MAG: hypothetical protein NTW04_03335, partial [Elusimicrobia bacterium]|nr:hypothetical protein [Elusimicrobiota bacterium]
SSLYIETSFPSGAGQNIKALERKIFEGLRNCGLLKKSDKIKSKLWLKIPCAYVIYDKNREKAVASAIKFLKQNDCQSLGRYGGWKYSFMEESLLEGFRSVQQLQP